jgi:hypothetical protein
LLIIASNNYPLGFAWLNDNSQQDIDNLPYPLVLVSKIILNFEADLASYSNNGFVTQ